eukprot:1767327-Prymnesium_polylepis.1
MVAICANVLLLCIWASPMDAGAKSIYDLGSYFFTMLFAAEAAIKVTAYSFTVYWQSHWNRFDLVLAVVS